MVEHRIRSTATGKDYVTNLERMIELARLGAAFEQLYWSWMQDADDVGVISGSAADQCAEVYQIFNQHGLPIK